MTSKITVATGSTAPRAELDLLPIASEARGNWLVKHLVSVKFGPGHFTPATIAKRARAAGCVGDVNAKHEVRYSDRHQWRVVNEFTVVV